MFCVFKNHLYFCIVNNPERISIIYSGHKLKRKWQKLFFQVRRLKSKIDCVVKLTERVA